MRDLFNNSKVVNAADAETLAGNTALTSHIIDRAGFEGLLFVINIGVKTDGVLTVLVEHDDAAGFGTAVAVPDSDLLGTEAAAGVADAAAGSQGVRKIGYQGDKRYVKCTVTASSNAGSCPASVVAILTAGRHNPAQGADGAAITQVP